MGERKRRVAPSRRTLIGPLAYLVMGAMGSAGLWYVLSGTPGSAAQDRERLDAADRHALDEVLRQRATHR